MLRPAGYFAKKIATRPEWLADTSVRDIYSISGCISEDFADYVNFWKHNGYWLFDAPSLIEDVARQANVSLDECEFFYYEAYELEFDRRSQTWAAYDPEKDFPLAVQGPEHPVLQGFDVATHSMRNMPECSPLSCNGLATEIPVNEHCLFATLDEAIAAIERGGFEHGEPGPLRIFAVFKIDPAYQDDDS
jgi:hypothetical protein